jgi:ribosomal protein L11 methyltransferase
MSWKQISFDVSDDLKDAVIGELSQEDVAGAWETDAGLVLYFGSRANLEIIENRIRAVFARSLQQTPIFSRNIVEDCDWTGEWKKSYTSFPIGDDFFVIPSWEDSNCPADRLPIRIDPGQAFGTGTHETTQMTVEALERWIEPRHVVLDIGTGSGILAIAARLLGAREVLACDIDPVAAQVARANIERNSEEDVLTFCGSVDAVRSGSVDVVTCNLTAELIISLFSEIDRVLQPCGIAIFSGILQEKHEEMRDIVSRFRFSIHEELTRGEWLALIAQKNAA